MVPCSCSVAALPVSLMRVWFPHTSGAKAAEPGSPPVALRGELGLLALSPPQDLWSRRGVARQCDSCCHRLVELLQKSMPVQ